MSNTGRKFLDTETRLRIDTQTHLKEVKEEYDDGINFNEFKDDIVKAQFEINDILKLNYKHADGEWLERLDDIKEKNTIQELSHDVNAICLRWEKIKDDVRRLKLKLQEVTEEESRRAWETLNNETKGIYEIVDRYHFPTNDNVKKSLYVILNNIDDTVTSKDTDFSDNIMFYYFRANELREHIKNVVIPNIIKRKVDDVRAECSRWFMKSLFAGKKKCEVDMENECPELKTLDEEFAMVDGKTTKTKSDKQVKTVDIDSVELRNKLETVIESFYGYIKEGVLIGSNVYQMLTNYVDYAFDPSVIDTRKTLRYSLQTAIQLEFSVEEIYTGYRHLRQFHRELPQDLDYYCEMYQLIYVYLVDLEETYRKEVLVNGEEFLTNEITGLINIFRKLPRSLRSGKSIVDDEKCVIVIEVDEEHGNELECRDLVHYINYAMRRIQRIILPRYIRYLCENRTNQLYSKIHSTIE